MSDAIWRMAVVDDQPAIQTIVQQAFRERGWEVEVFEDGDTASEALKSRQFDVVLLDLKLPGKPGLELLQEMRKQCPDTEVIVVTGYASVDSAIKALELDAYAYITKPFEMTHLISSVENAQEKLRLQRLNSELIRLLCHNESELERAIGEATQELTAANVRLQEMAARDGLTGLFNRRYFDERLEEEIHRAVRYNSCLTLALVDIDHFKRYNDTYGHLRGDDALVILASVLQENVRRNDMVARFGGEEFALILIQAKDADVAVICERIRAAVECTAFPAHEAAQPARLTVSIGYAHCPGDTTDMAELIQFADSALYVAKSEGRNRVCSYCKVRDRAQEHIPSARPKHLPY